MKMISLGTMFPLKISMQFILSFFISSHFCLRPLRLVKHDFRYFMLGVWVVYSKPDDTNNRIQNEVIDMSVTQNKSLSKCLRSNASREKTCVSMMINIVIFFIFSLEANYDTSYKLVWLSSNLRAKTAEKSMCLRHQRQTHDPHNNYV